MKAGVIGMVNGDFNRIKPLYDTFTQNEIKLERGIEIVNDSITLSDGSSAIYGRAAMQRLKEKKSVQIREGSIGEHKEPEPEALYTEFLSLPGDVVIVNSSSGMFAFDLIGAQTNTLIERAGFEIEEFVETHQREHFWQARFKNNVGNAENGVVYGNDVLNDSDLDHVLGNSKISQVGLDYIYKEDEIKITVTESGYINLYNPSNYESKEFLQYFKDELIGYVTTDN